MNKEEILTKTEEYVKKEMLNESTGHDWFHIRRVLDNALKITKKEGGDLFIIKMSALLHDIGDPKLHNGDETAAKRIVGNWLEKMEMNKEEINSILYIIENLSFSKSLKNQHIKKTKEFMIVQDADRLDAIGAIAIARVFAYGGATGRNIYNPKFNPRNVNYENYKNGSRDSFSHFYEKIILLKDMLNTKTAKKIGEKRHKFLEKYIKQFLSEWEGKDF